MKNRQLKRKQINYFSKTNVMLFTGFALGTYLTALTYWTLTNYSVQSPIKLQPMFVRRSEIAEDLSSEQVKENGTSLITPKAGDGAQKSFTPSPSPTPTMKPKRTLVPVVEAAEVSQPTNKEIADYIKSKDWDYDVAIRIAKSENFWNYDKSFHCGRTGGVNSNGTQDHGLWQINDIHIKSGAITLEDANDCFKATDFAYGLYKGRGNWSAWSAYNNGNYLNHSTEI